jgi:hypothetical protein
MPGDPPDRNPDTIAIWKRECDNAAQWANASAILSSAIAYGTGPDISAPHKNPYGFVSLTPLEFMTALEPRFGNVSNSHIAILMEHLMRQLQSQTPDAYTLHVGFFRQTLDRLNAQNEVQGRFDQITRFKETIKHLPIVHQGYVQFLIHTPDVNDQNLENLTSYIEDFLHTFTVEDDAALSLQPQASADSAAHFADKTGFISSIYSVSPSKQNTSLSFYTGGRGRGGGGGRGTPNTTPNPPTHWCFVHKNCYHSGSDCLVMKNNTAYTDIQRNATSESQISGGKGRGRGGRGGRAATENK